MSESQGHGKWLSWVARVYYLLGTAYYSYHLLFLLGITGVTTAILLRVKSGPIVASVITTVSVFSLLVAVSFWRKVVRLQFMSPNPSLHIKRIIVDYHYMDPLNCDYVRTVEAVALYPTDRYCAKFKWSSDGQVTGEALAGAKKVDVSEQSTSMFNMCRVEFERMLTKNQTLTFSYRLKLRDARKPVKRFLGHVVDLPTKMLTLTVKLPQNEEVKEYRKQLFISTESEIPLWEETQIVAEPWKKEIGWEIPKAKQGCVYRISW